MLLTRYIFYTYSKLFILRKIIDKISVTIVKIVVIITKLTLIYIIN